MIGAIAAGGAQGYQAAGGWGRYGAQGGGQVSEPAAEPVSAPSGKVADAKELSEKYRCKTCESRTYMDGSNDPGVSMKTPTKISPQSAAMAVMGHEQQHVARNAFKAQAEGRRVLSSTVTLHTGVCGECGKPYVAGGTTRTVTAAKAEYQQQQQGGEPQGGGLNVRA